MVKKKSTAKTKKTNSKTAKYDPKYVLCHPSTWIAAILALALLVTYGVSMYGFDHIQPKTSFESSQLAVFDELATSFIRDMDISDAKQYKQITGYGVSDEDGVFYITFDFADLPTNGQTITSMDDLDFKHGIIYFWPDEERGTYSHAFSYHDDASYRPGGTYVKLEQAR